MADKLKVLFLYLVYPLAMGTYFKRALQRRADVDLKVVGSYSGAFIPWLGGMNLPVKYAVPPDLYLPFPPTSKTVSYDMVKLQMKDWVPDLVLTADAGTHWDSKPTDGVVAHIATDPHVLDYSVPRSYSDKFFNMQKCYSEPGDIWLPYAYDPTVFHPEPDTVADYDACLVGMPYSQRVQWVEALRRKGLRVAFENGPVFDEARALYARSKIGLNWSSMNDLNARVFEVMGMGLPLVTNFVPDIGLLFEAGKQFYGFFDLEQAVTSTVFLKEHPDIAKKMGDAALEAVRPHTYDARVATILQECGF